jgi:hypothetical protein
MAAKDFNDQKKPAGRASWRGKPAPGQAGGAAARRWQAGFRRQQRAEVWRRTLSRRAWRLITSATAVVLLGIFLYYLLLRPTPAPVLALAITDYPLPLPPNAWAREDIARLGEPRAFKTAGFASSGRPDKQGNILVHALDEQNWTLPKNALADLRQALKKTTPGGISWPRRKVVLVYLSAHGVVNDKGEACLVLSGNQPLPARETAIPPHLDADRWLPVREIVQELEKHFPRCKKVLLLDANRMDANWALGLLYNAFAAALPAALGSAKNVVIINATSPGQVACGSNYLDGGSSAFGYFTRLALRGDGADKDQSGTISLYELRDYLTRHVSQWALRNRLQAQRPMLLPESAADFELAYTAPQAFRPQGEPGVGESAPSMRASAHDEKLSALWRVHERCRPWNADATPNPIAAACGTDREKLAQWTQFGAKLIRAEQLLDAGAAYRPAANDAISELTTLARELQKPGTRAECAAHSLPLARIRLAGAEAVASSPQPVDSDAQPPASGTEAPGVRYVTSADGAWQKALALETSNISGKALAQLRQSVAEADADFGPEVVEMRWLALLGGTRHLPTNASTADLAASLRCRDAAERAAAPGDERAHYVGRKLVIAGDAKRRPADDALFIGSPAADPQIAAEQRKDALDNYDRATRQSAALAAALHTRDRAYAELPYLAQWFTRRTHHDASATDLDARVNQVVATAHDLHQLAAKIDNVTSQTLEPGVDPQQIDEIAALDQSISERLQALRRGFDADVAEVRTAAAINPALLRRVAELLALPLLTGDQRNELRTIYQQIDAQFASDPTVGAEAPPDDDASYLRRIAFVWAEHPALALLNERLPALIQHAADGAGTPRPPEGNMSAKDLLTATAKLRVCGSQVRKRLATANTIVQNLLEVKIGSNNLTDVRRNLSEADRLARVVVPLAGGAPLLADDPVRRLALFDLNQLLLFHADRALDDFYGPAREGDRPYFESVCGHYQQSAQQAAENLALPLGWKNVALFQQRVAAAKSWLTLAADPPSGLDWRFTVKSMAELPAGEAALYVVDPKKSPVNLKLASTTRSGAPLERLAQTVGNGRASVDSHQLAIQLQPPSQQNGGNSLVPGDYQLVAFYRGHHRELPFRVGPLGPGIELVSKRKPRNTAHVTVRGDVKERATIVFVLDCSGSMANQLDPRTGQVMVDALGRKLATYGRMNAARAALERILSDLAKIGKYDVALWLYGHRVGNDESGRTVWNEAAWGPRDPSVVPANDVQPVIEAQPLDEQSLNGVFLPQLNRKVNDPSRGQRFQVGPYGQTPLYRAICDAAQSLSRLDSEQRRLIVITDGKNEVTGPPVGRDTEQDVIRALEGTDIRLDIVGVEVERDAQAIIAGLFSAGSIKGDYHPVRNLKALTDELAQSLGLYRYAVEEVQRNQWLPRGEATLGTPVEVDHLGPLPKIFRARLLGAGQAAESRFKLQGGEALQLEVTLQGQSRRLVHQRYTHLNQMPVQIDNLRNPQWKDSDDPAFNPQKFFVGLQWPQSLAADKLLFRLSLQNNDPALFSPRPAEAWVQITPLVEGKPAEGLFSYPFYDLNFEDDRPVPVLECTAPRWPEGAKQASINLWFKIAQATPPSRAASIAEILRSEGQLRLDDVAEAVFSVRVEPLADGIGTAAIVSERYPPETTDPWRVKVDMNEPADEVRRVYYPERIMAEHTFLYFNAAQQDVRTYTVELTSRAALEQDAVTLPQPATVSIVEQHVGDRPR